MKLSDKAEASLNKVVDKFMNDDLGAICEVAFLDPTELDIPLAKWSFRNKCLAAAQTGDIDVRGYRQWQRSGRNVKKGTAAAYILRPVLITKKDDDGEEKQLLAGYASVPVFGFSDTEGDGWVPEYAPSSPPPLLHLAEILGVKVDYDLRPLIAGGLGQYDLIKDEIRLASHDYRVFFHELAHALHSRIEPLAEASKVSKETVAEFTACVLMDIYGVDYSGTSWRYIEQYDDDPLMAVIKSLGTIEKVIDLMVELDQEPQLERNIYDETLDYMPALQYAGV